MASYAKWLVALGLGVAGGWALRSLADSPQGAGVKLMELALKAKERVGHWAAVEGEHLEDMFAEARAKVEPDIAPPKVAATKIRRRPSSRAHA
jgi:hypothetical protein